MWLLQQMQACVAPGCTAVSQITDTGMAAPAKQAAEQEKERIKAAEAAKAEAERIAKMQELEGQGKKVSGGMHKFDASEVDVHGGNATADDFMDAFGF